MPRAKEHWKKAMRYCNEQREFELDTLPDSQADTCTSSRRINDRQNSLYLDTGQTHMVWKPKHSLKKETTGFTDVVMEVIENRRTLLERQQKLLRRVEATRKVLKSQKEKLATLEEESSSDDEENSEGQQPTRKDGKKWQDVVARVKEDNSKKAQFASKRKMSTQFHDIVSQYVSDMSTSSPNDGARLTTGPTEAGGAALYSRQRAAPVHAATMSLLHWKSQVFEDQKERKRHTEPNKKGKK